MTKVNEQSIRAAVTDGVLTTLISEIVERIGAHRLGRKKHHFGRPKRKRRREKPDPKKVQRARAAHVPQNAQRVAIATGNERKISRVVGANKIPDNAEFDNANLRHKYLIEIKTLLPGARNDKLTMHGPSAADPVGALGRKKLFATKTGWAAHTVGIDMRGGGFTVYHKPWVGSYRLSAMQKVGDLFEGSQQAGKLNPATVRSLNGLLRAKSNEALGKTDKRLAKLVRKHGKSYGLGGK